MGGSNRAYNNYSQYGPISLPLSLLLSVHRLSGDVRPWRSAMARPGNVLPCLRQGTSRALAEPPAPGTGFAHVEKQRTATFGSMAHQGEI
jgi:hypothetical protein